MDGYDEPETMSYHDMLCETLFSSSLYSFYFGPNDGEQEETGGLQVSLLIL